MNSSISSFSPLYKVLLFLVCAICCFGALHFLFDERYQENTLYKTQWTFQKHDHFYDYTILGSSRSYDGLDVKRINENTGLKGINISLDGSLISTQALIADVFFNRLNNNTRYLFIQADYWNVDQEGTTDIADSRLLPYLDWEEVFDHYKRFGYRWYLYRYIPYWKYAEYNYYWGPHIFLNTYMHFIKSEFDTVTGSHAFPNNVFVGNKEAQHIVFPENPKLTFLLKLADICQEKHIKLIYLTLPFAAIEKTETSQKSVASFKQLCQQHRIGFLDMSDLLNNRYEYFYDAVHTNHNGALITSDSLSVYLKNDLNNLSN